jgi:hypothetical protein
MTRNIMNTGNRLWAAVCVSGHKQSLSLSPSGALDAAAGLEMAQRKTPRDEAWFWSDARDVAKGG